MPFKKSGFLWEGAATISGIFGDVTAPPPFLFFVHAYFDIFNIAMIGFVESLNPRVSFFKKQVTIPSLQIYFQRVALLVESKKILGV